MLFRETRTVEGESKFKCKQRYKFGPLSPTQLYSSLLALTMLSNQCFTYCNPRFPRFLFILLVSEETDGSIEYDAHRENLRRPLSFSPQHGMKRKRPRYLSCLCMPSIHSLLIDELHTNTRRHWIAASENLKRYNINISR